MKKNKKKNFPFAYIELCGGRVPERKTRGSAAYDLYIPEDTTIKCGRQLVPLGIKLRLPSTWEALIDSRSGFAAKGMEGYCTGDKNFENPKRFDADVIQGKIDSDYPDIINVIVKSYEVQPFVIKAGTRIAQISFIQVQHPDIRIGRVLPTTDRNGGIGSTGTTDKN